jgi:hypothetical protein
MFTPESGWTIAATEPFMLNGRNHGWTRMNTDGTGLTRISQIPTKYFQFVSNL